MGTWETANRPLGLSTGRGERVERPEMKTVDHDENKILLQPE